ncbi:hypothetical protein Tco_0066549 [Tanacetum coccineum]
MTMIALWAIVGPGLSTHKASFLAAAETLSNLTTRADDTSLISTSSALGLRGRIRGDKKDGHRSRGVGCLILSWHLSPQEVAQAPGMCLPPNNLPVGTASSKVLRWNTPRSCYQSEQKYKVNGRRESAEHDYCDR